jgi:hypothetical protein
VNIPCQRQHGWSAERTGTLESTSTALLPVGTTMSSLSIVSAGGFCNLIDVWYSTMRTARLRCQLCCLAAFQSRSASLQERLSPGDFDAAQGMHDNRTHSKSAGYCVFAQQRNNRSNHTVPKAPSELSHADQSLTILTCLPMIACNIRGGFVQILISTFPVRRQCSILHVGSLSGPQLWQNRPCHLPTGTRTVMITPSSVDVTL